MSITPPSNLQLERRAQPRRVADRVADDQHKTFSTPYCHACLEHKGDGVLLLNNETHVIYATSQVEKILKRHNLPLALSPKFTLHQAHHAVRFAAFANRNNHDTGSLCLPLEDENRRELLLLNCFQLPKPAEPDRQIARYMITLRDPNHHPTQQWLLFNKQYNLTPTEARLCQAFADGLTLNDYREKWHVATSTARSQLHSIFNKTSTHRQSDLLRLIFLFTRT
jgi:DNA-binding CsgD family transcriptional regulator